MLIHSMFLTELLLESSCGTVLAWLQHTENVRVRTSLHQVSVTSGTRTPGTMITEPLEKGG
eukprot:1148208-Pelagomonas_calceolata.AAC.17